MPIPNNTESVLVKAPYRRTVFTEQQLAEFIACADPETGPEYFMDNFFHIQHPTRGKMLYHPFVLYYSTILSINYYMQIY